MPRPVSATPLPRLHIIAALVGTVFVLYLAREVLIPLIFAALVSTLLLPAVERLVHWRLNRIAASVLVGILALVPVVFVGWVVLVQVTVVLDTLPAYRENIAARFDAVRGPLEDFSRRFADLARDVEAGTAATPPDGAERPVPVTVTAAPSTLRSLWQTLTPLLRPFATLGIVWVFVVFFLVFAADVRDRVLRLLSMGRLAATTAVLEDIAGRVSRFLRVQFLINAGNGVVIGTGLIALGVPNAVLWGFLAAVLRYIPYFGAVIASLFPIALTFATSEGWQHPLAVIAFLLAWEILANNFIEPMIYGTRIGVSALALLIAALFWAWLWGFWGLLLSTPMTVCLVVLGRHVPALRFLHVLLGDEPVLDPQQKFYQRLLAMDAEDAADIAQDYAKAHSPARAFDDLFVPALECAAHDADECAIDAPRHRYVLHALRDLVDDAALPPPSLPRAAGSVAVSSDDGRPAPSATLHPDAGPVLLLPAKDEADSIAALMVQSLLHQRGITVRLLWPDDLGGDLAALLAAAAPAAILISALPANAASHARIRARQLARKAPGIPVAVGVWNSPDSADRLRQRLRPLGVTHAVRSVEQAADLLSTLAAPATRVHPPAPSPSTTN